MIRIDVKELENNLDKYLLLAESEMIEITKEDKIIFSLVPHKQYLLSEWNHFFGSLPLEALNDKDINRE